MSWFDTWHQRGSAGIMVANSLMSRGITLVRWRCSSKLPITCVRTFAAPELPRSRRLQLSRSASSTYSYGIARGRLRGSSHVTGSAALILDLRPMRAGRPKYVLSGVWVVAGRGEKGEVTTYSLIVSQPGIQRHMMMAERRPGERVSTVGDGRDRDGAVVADGECGPAVV